MMSIMFQFFYLLPNTQERFHSLPFIILILGYVPIVFYYFLLFMLSCLSSSQFHSPTIPHPCGSFPLAHPLFFPTGFWGLCRGFDAPAWFASHFIQILLFSLLCFSSTVLLVKPLCAIPLSGGSTTVFRVPLKLYKSKHWPSNQDEKMGKYIILWALSHFLTHFTLLAPGGVSPGKTH